MPYESAPSRALGFTARWAAAARARESQREDRLFNDPWSAMLAGREGMEWIEQRPEDSSIPMIIRTRFFDDFLTHITCEQSIRQVVIMASGLDTRAFRLKWPDHMRLFELDQPHVLQYKEQVLSTAGAQPTCERQSIEVDLTSTWQEPLLSRGFDPQQPSCWLLEGFLFYLPDQHIERILNEVTNLAARRSCIGFDIINSITLTSPWTRAWIEMQAQYGAPWIGSIDNPVEFLAALNWQATLTQGGAQDASYGRWKLPTIPVTMPGMPHNWFVTAKKL